MGEPGRFFLGLALAPQDRAPVAAAVRVALGGDAGPRSYRLARAEGLHLTLHFFGDLTRDERERVEALLPGLADAQAPRLALDAPGAFPDAGRPRVLWLGVRGELDRLDGLRNRILLALGEAGFDVERERGRPFRPHVTVARPRGPGPAPGTFLRLEPGGSLVGEELVLFESIRGDGPARYAPRATQRLGSGA